METRLQHLVQKLEELVEEETESSDHPWLTRTVLEQLFDQKYGSSLENILQDYGYFDLKTFLRKSHIFAIYETPIPQNFYISLLRKTVPGHKQSSISNQSMFYTIKRPWKVERPMIKDLQDDGYSAKYTQIPTKKNQSSNQISKTFNPIYKKIESQDDFKFSLVEIVKTLLGNKKNYVTIDELNNQFYTNYDQSIKEVRSKIYPNIKLIDLLQTIPELKLEKIQNTWRITLDKY
ncbi:MAG: hypothetical protein RSE13_20355 [Planktothrix sp. GU0601_MAG3]|nr:MAG: hypothetical protein RSE13_20355 [Planktothrix sp. GU0601_MAG3]